MVESDQTDADIAITLEPRSLNDRMSLFSLAHGLSKREAEIVAACASGTDPAVWPRNYSCRRTRSRRAARNRPRPLASRGEARINNRAHPEFNSQPI
jgi:hypothetical protein